MTHGGLHRSATALMLGVVGAAMHGTAWAQAGERTPAAADAVVFPVSCSAPARSEFNRGIELLHHMTYPGARASFERAAAIEPRCAMAHWGIAMTLFQPLWPTRPGRADLRRGHEAAERARTLGAPTQRERLFVDAAAAFFRDPDSADYWTRIRRWEDAMRRAHTALPDDAEISAFYALAHLAVAPVDTLRRGHGERAATILLRVHERHPGHPGAQHYLVHANDAPGREQQSPEIVKAYAVAAPRNPHALHMPTHIQTRLGDWDGVIAGNLRAADAALEYPAGDKGDLVWDEFPHAIEYLIYGLLQKGQDTEAAAQLKRLHGTARLQPSFKTAFHLSATRARHALERRAWREAAALPAREPASLDWDRFTWPEAITWFARGLGAVRESRLDDARAAAARLAALDSAASQGGEPLFARNVRVLGLELRAWLAHAERDTPASVRLMTEAAELEAATPKHAVTPGPILPGYELLGDLLMEQRRPAEALAAYRRSLELHPLRFNGLLGAARAARASGEQAAARANYGEMLRVAAGGTRSSAIDEARGYVASGR